MNWPSRRAHFAGRSMVAVWCMARRLYSAGSTIALDGWIGGVTENLKNSVTTHEPIYVACEHDAFRFSHSLEKLGAAVLGVREVRQHRLVLGVSTHPSKVCRLTGQVVTGSPRLCGTIVRKNIRSTPWVS